MREWIRTRWAALAAWASRLLGRSPGAPCAYEITDPEGGVIGTITSTKPLVTEEPISPENRDLILSALVVANYLNPVPITATGTKDRIHVSFEGQWIFTLTRRP